MKIPTIFQGTYELQIVREDVIFYTEVNCIKPKSAIRPGKVHDPLAYALSCVFRLLSFILLSKPDSPSIATLSRSWW